MNQILILEPRWSTRDVLIADHRLFAHNEIVIQHKDFPDPLYITAERARQFPLEYMDTRKGGKLAVRIVPIAELLAERIEA